MEAKQNDVDFLLDIDTLVLGTYVAHCSSVAVYDSSAEKLKHCFAIRKIRQQQSSTNPKKYNVIIPVQDIDAIMISKFRARSGCYLFLDVSPECAEKIAQFLDFDPEEFEFSAPARIRMHFAKDEQDTKDRFRQFVKLLTDFIGERYDNVRIVEPLVAEDEYQESRYRRLIEKELSDLDELTLSDDDGNDGKLSVKARLSDRELIVNERIIGSEVVRFKAETISFRSLQELTITKATHPRLIFAQNNQGLVHINFCQNIAGYVLIRFHLKTPLSKLIEVLDKLGYRTDDGSMQVRPFLELESEYFKKAYEISKTLLIKQEQK